MREPGDPGVSDDVQDKASSEEAMRPRRRPDNELPGSVAVDAVLATSEDLVIFVCGLSVYRNGIDLTVEVRARPGRSVAHPEGLLAEVGGHGDGWDPLRLGVEFSDGRSCGNVGGSQAATRDASKEPPRLLSERAIGDDRSASTSWFLSPLPPPGDLRIVCSWPSHRVPETITTLSTEPILRAAAHARELWPWQPRSEAG
jgi:hypothetical protein